MARPLRIERPGGRYHVTARGNERKRIYRTDGDRLKFLELVAHLNERFGARVHAYVLMDNHFHLLVETPEANLSRAMQWLNVGYSVWFNRRHQRVGHLFQGRFKAVVVEDDAGWQEVARYVHLNPVRVAGLALDKRQQAASRVGMVEAPAAEVVAARLKLLRQWRWSSYRAYAGYCAAPSWLWRESVERLCGGKAEAERRAALREYTEQAVRQGAIERPWDRLVAGLVLGTEAFARQLARGLRANSREQAQLKALTGRVLPWSRIVSAVEAAKGEKWKQFSLRHGDWGRDVALWLGRKHARLGLRELGELAGGMDYAAVGQAVARLGKRMEREPRLRRQTAEIETELLKC
jgi:REP element-mobilizing transposase RayT